MSNQLAIPFKRSSPIQIRQAVRDYLQRNHSDTHPDTFNWDVQRWEDLRQESLKGTAHAVQIDSLMRYYAQLTFILTKLPDEIGILVSYSQAFDELKPWTTLQSLAFERASVLFNLAALYSQLALAEDRSHTEGIKRANKNQQNAAGALSLLARSCTPQLLRTADTESIPLELRESSIRALEYLMLAQAQECAWQKAVADHLKNNIIAKLAVQVAHYYRLSVETAKKGDIAAAFPLEWIAHISTKWHHFEAAALYRKSMSDLESNLYGHELARLMEAQAIARRAYEDARHANVARPVLNDIKSLADVLGSHISRAERDNDLIYHQEVPPFSSLPPIQGSDLVRSTLDPGLQDLKSLVDADGVLFGDLLAHGAKLAIVIYKNRVQNWLQEEIMDRLNELNDQADRLLHELSLPACLEALDHVGLPPSLLRKAQEFQLEDGITRIEQSLENAEQFSQYCRDILSEAMDLLDQEASEDEGMRRNAARSGRPWTRQASFEANVELTKKEQRYRSMLDDASEADDTVRGKWDDWEEAISRLTSGEEDLEAWLPFPAISPEQANDAAALKTQKIARHLRAHLEALDEIRRDRSQLVQRTRQLCESDDIQPRISREAAGIELWTDVKPEMFESALEQELSKYEKFRDELSDNADLQTKILNQIELCHGQFIQSRRDDPIIKEREQALQSLDLAYHKYREITRNLDEGLKFYNDLANILVQFREACKHWVRSRRDEIHALTLSLEALQMDEDRLPTPRASLANISLAHAQQHRPVIDPATGASLVLPPPDSREWQR